MSVPVNNSRVIKQIRFSFNLPYQDLNIFRKEDAFPFIREVNKRIAELRIKKGFTQEKMAEKMNVEVRTIRRWEAGANISLWVLYRYQIVLDQDASRFFKKKDHIKKAKNKE